MFGDIGHGSILLAIGIYLMVHDDWISKKGGFFSTFSKLRYMVTLMGFFSFYCGWIYNDILGFSYNFFGSCYTKDK
jgi:V-type H+-transporting ATPase subunit a